jgi:taurine dioxygenase
LFATYAGAWCFRQQPLTPPQFMQAAEIFGPLTPQQIKEFVLPDYPLVGYNSTHDLPRKTASCRCGGRTTTPTIPTTWRHQSHHLGGGGDSVHGGDTQFVDARQAFDDLPEAMKHASWACARCTRTQSSRSPRSFAKLSEEEMARIPRTLQPLVIRHPDSGRVATLTPDAWKALRAWTTRRVTP